jgi:hypothetical protein
LRDIKGTQLLKLIGAVLLGSEVLW